MSINHNRIKVADLETDLPNKILTTNNNGELEFTDIENIQTDSYNALDYTEEGKSLDARQGKILKDLVDEKINKVDGKNLLSNSEITRLSTLSNYTHPTNHPPSIITQDPSNRFVSDTEKTVWNNKQSSLGYEPENTANKSNNIADISSSSKFPVWKVITDWALSLFKKKLLAINAQTGTAYTLQISDAVDPTRVTFSNTNPIALTIPTNTNTAIAIGSKIEITQLSTGVITIGGSGVTLTSNLSLLMTQGETRILTKIAIDTWTIEGNRNKDNAKMPFTVFIDTVNGNDNTGILEDSSRPYKLFSAALAAMPVNNGIMWTVYYLDSSPTRQLIAINRPLKIQTPNSGTFLYTEISGELAGGSTFEIDAPLSNLTITLASGNTCSMRPTIFLKLVLNKISLYAFHTGYEGFFGRSSSTVETIYMKMNEFYVENSITGVRLFNGKGDIIARKFTSKALNMRLKNDNQIGIRISFDEVVSDTYPMRLERQDPNFYYKISKYSGTMNIIDTLSLVVDLDNVLITAPNVSFTNFNRLKGSNIYPASVVTLNLQNAISPLFVDNYEGVIDSVYDIPPSTTIKNSTLFISGVFINGAGFMQQGNRTLSLSNVNIIQTNTAYLFTFQNTTYPILTVIKNGFLKTNATTLVNPSTSPTTGILLTDKTPNSF